VADRIVHEVEEDLLESVVVGPDHRNVLVHTHGHRGTCGRIQTVSRRLQQQAEVTPVPLQPQDPGLDRGVVEQVLHQPAQPL